MYLFPFDKIKKNSKLIIYGGGKVGYDYISQLLEVSFCELVSVIDKQSKTCMANKLFRVSDIDELNTKEYDYLLIAAKEITLREEIKQICLDRGIDKKKIVSTSPPFILLKDSGYYISQNQWWGAISYSQHGDDMMVLNIFRLLKIARPSYLDIGAHHPFNISNTTLLYQRGCRGINVEANPNLIQSFYEERPEDINICIGIGCKIGELPFYMIDKSSGRNSFDKEAVDSFVKRYPDLRISEVMKVPVITLDKLIDTYANGEFPDYLTIDIEGLDYDVLDSYDLNINGPKVITVEVEFAGGDMKNSIKQLLEKKGYFVYCRTGANVIFVKSIYRNALY